MRSEDEGDLRRSHRASLEQQEGLDPEPLDEPRRGRDDKAERLEDERPEEQEEGIAASRRGSDAAPSDRPENEPPHPQDVNEIGERG